MYTRGVSPTSIYSKKCALAWFGIKNYNLLLFGLFLQNGKLEIVLYDLSIHKQPVMDVQEIYGEVLIS